MSLASNISAARHKAEVSQEALARSSGISLWSMGAIERGAQIPRADTIGRIALALGVTTDSLIFGNDREVSP